MSALFFKLWTVSKCEFVDLAVRKIIYKWVILLTFDQSSCDESATEALKPSGFDASASIHGRFITTFLSKCYIVLTEDIKT